MSTFSPASEATFRSLTRHDEYYLNGGDLHFLVEHVSFRVHRYFFDRESGYFRGKLAVPASPGATRQGTEDSNAIVLDDCKASEFARFLWVFYNPRYSLYDATVEEWCSVLRLATQWEFPEVKALCIRQLEILTMSDVDRIHIYHLYGVDRNLLIPRYAALSVREEPLTVPEGCKLGMETTLMIVRARECARAAPRADSGARSPTRADIEPVVMHDIIKDVFKIEPAVADKPSVAVLTNGVNGTNGIHSSKETTSPGTVNLLDTATDVVILNGAAGAANSKESGKDKTTDSTKNSDSNANTKSSTVSSPKPRNKSSK